MPPSDDLRQQLRREVGLFRARESRRRFDTMVYVGSLAGERDSLVVRAQDRPVMDSGLRVDVVATLLEFLPPTCHHAWLTRPGVPETHDEDLGWFAAASAAFGLAGRRLDGFFAVTRHGWLDIRSGEQRVWRRLRL